jgi:hypothetical protein
MLQNNLEVSIFHIYQVNSSLRKPFQAGCQWFMPVILATQKAEIRRIIVQSQPRLF